MENVGGLLSARGKPFMARMLSECDNHHYKLHIRKLDAYDYGVPQHRRRAIIVGEANIGCLTRYSFPPPINVGSTPSTVREAIHDLISMTEGDVPNHRADRLSDVNLQRIRSVKEGQGRSLFLHTCSWAVT